MPRVLYFLLDICGRYSKCHTKTLFFMIVFLYFHRIFVTVYGEHSLSETKCRDWFRRFKSGDFDLCNKDRGKLRKKF